MDESYLITGNYSPLNRSLVSRLVKKKSRVIATVDKENEELLFSDNTREYLKTIAYDRRSPFSARALFMDMMNKSIQIDHVLILHSILGKSDVLQGINSRHIEEKIDDEIKGFMFFLKEAVGYFERRGRGSINIILQNNGPDVPGPLDALVFGGIQNLSNSLFTYYVRESFVLRGFTTKDPDNENFGEYIFQTIGENKQSGKWYRYRSKGNFFNFVRN